MTTIYIVTRGEYSDYRICEVLSTKELAEAALVRWQGWGGPPEIEEWELDKFTGSLPKWSVRLKDTNLELLMCQQDTFDEGKEWASHVPSSGWWHIVLFAATPDGAVHIARERVEAAQKSMEKGGTTAPIRPKKI